MSYHGRGSPVILQLKKDGSANLPELGLNALSLSNSIRAWAERGRLAHPRHDTGEIRFGIVFLPRIIRRRSPVHGFGVFAAEPINKNKRIIDYAGELVRTKDCLAREIRYLDQGRLWIYRVNRVWSRDAAVGGNIARFINHSCTPNCWTEIVGMTIWIRASTRIARGEELTYDYCTVGSRIIPCRCRPGCKRML